MSELSERLKSTIQADGGANEAALIEVLRSELYCVFRQFTDVEDLQISVRSGEINVSVKCGEVKRIGVHLG
ncbi:MAG: hypothetical protein IKC48_00190 [Clostridia bacterium]|nr:hypothetical protein [Clostridia bacterium]